MSQLRDEQLYEQLKSRDKAALEELYNRYERILYSFIYRFTNDPGIAEEVMQDVFIKLWQQKANYDQSKGRFSSWLLTVARNAAIDGIRKTKKNLVELTEQDQDKQTSASVEELVEKKEEEGLIHHAIERLTEDQKQVIQLFYFKGYTQQKIAEACNIPLGTVKGRLRLALQHLKKSLSQQGGRGDIS